MSHILYKEFYCSCVLNFIVNMGLSLLSGKGFHYIALCLSMPKINSPVSDSQNVNQHPLRRSYWTSFPCLPWIDTLLALVFAEITTNISL